MPLESQKGIRRKLHILQVKFLAYMGDPESYRAAKFLAAYERARMCRFSQAQYVYRKALPLRMHAARAYRLPVEQGSSSWLRKRRV